jgi:hypothetical protein
MGSAEYENKGGAVKKCVVMFCCSVSGEHIVALLAARREDNAQI